MLVHEAKKALLFVTQHPGQILSVIPKAKALKEKNGKTVMAVKHTPDVVKVLNNIGVPAPHPIKFYYHWPSKYPKPMAHQVETAAFLASNKRAYCLNGLGSAKTLSSLWAFHYLKHEGLVDAALVLGPLSTLERTWADEVFYNFRDIDASVLHGTAAKRKKLLAQESDVYVINHDGISVVLEELQDLMRRKRVVLIVDELTVFRNARAKRWKACQSLVALSAFAWGLTGTPIPNDPCDAYGQIKLLTPERVPRSFTQFRDMVSQPVGPYKRVPRKNATETVHNMMQPAIRYATRDCVDLPPTTYVMRHAPLSEEQDKAFKRMQREKVFQLTDQSAKIVAPNEAIVAMKLLQVAIGAVLTTEDEGVARLQSPQRLEVVREIIEQAEGKVIVFCPFLGGLDYITEELRKDGRRVSQVDGRVSKVDRDRIFSEFQTVGTDIIVAQPGAMSHGVTLTAGSVIVWYAPCYSNETYEQANARIVRPGQKRNTLIVNIEGTTLEKNIYERLKNRQAVQGKLLSMVEKG